MFSEQDQQKKSIFRNPLVYSSAALVIALMVIAWIFFSRWYQSRELEATAKQAQEQRQREDDRLALEQFGGKELAIQNFYAVPATAHLGQTVQLCYGVANAKTIKLEPQSTPVWPSYSRCVDVKPTATTTYKLSISDATGNTKSQTLEVRVR